MKGQQQMKNTDKTEVTDAGNAPRSIATQPQHSPLPWEVSNGEHYDGTAILSGDDLIADCVVYNGAREGLSRSKANARLIVASVNNAAKLAEAARRLYNKGPIDSTPEDWSNLRAELAAWEAA
jgi:hypothetical protein